jgi:hypothetical protein
MVRPCVARGFLDLSALRSCINVSGLCLERVVLRAIMDISARAFSLVFHRASPDLQRMKPLLCCARIVGTEVAYPLGAIKPVH